MLKIIVYLLCCFRVEEGEDYCNILCLEVILFRELYVLRLKLYVNIFLVFLSIFINFFENNEKDI